MVSKLRLDGTKISYLNFPISSPNPFLYTHISSTKTELLIRNKYIQARKNYLTNPPYQHYIQH